MPISSETRAALELLKEVQTKVRQTEDLRNNRQVGADLNALISVLESPVFQSILNIQDSLRELKRQVIQMLQTVVNLQESKQLVNFQVQLHPSILPADFDITPSGELVLNLPPSPGADSFQNGYDPEAANGNSKAFKAKTENNDMKNVRHFLSK